MLICLDFEKEVNNDSMEKLIELESSMKLSVKLLSNIGGGQCCIMLHSAA